MKKKLALGLIALFVFALHRSAAAEIKTDAFTVAPQVSYITYKEKSAGMEETGIFYGVLGTYVHRAESSREMANAMFKAEGRLSLGRVNYDGQLSNGTPYEIKGVNDALIELRGIVGNDFNVLSSTTITPFTGLGYRFLSDNLSKDPAGYRRFSNYLYSPMGVETNTTFSNGWAAGLSAEYDAFWFGRQYSYLSDLDSSFSDVTNEQDKGYGLRASLKLSKNADNFNVVVEPYFIYWNIDRSNDAALTLSGTVVGAVYEPQNTSTEVGMKVGFEF